MKKRQILWLGVVLLLLTFSCHDSLQEGPQVQQNGNQVQMRFLTVPSMIGNIQLFVFSTTPTDTVLYQLPPLVTGTALSSPVTLTLPPGNYAIAALANTDGRVASFTPGTTRIADVMLSLTENPSLTGNYGSAGPWFWGVNKLVQMGTDLTAVIEMKRLIAKAVITYTHADPNLTRVKMSIDGIARQAFINGHFNTIQGQGISVIKDLQSISGKATVDSLILLPTVNAVSNVKLEMTRNTSSGSETFSYSSALSVPIKSNYITNIQINGGEQNSITVSELPWDTGSATVMLDESPSADIGLALGDFTQVENDTTKLQAIDLSVAITGGIPSNYTGNFTYTITKLTPNTGSYTQTVPMQVVNGKLTTKAAIPLSRGTYQLVNYKLIDAEGIVPDPNNKALPVPFTVGLTYQTVNLTMDGRQEADNALMLLAVKKMHGTATAGSIYPGTSKYNSRPLPVTYPPSGAAITNSSWYVDANNNLTLIPIRGEWRVYSAVYRGFTTKLTGTLPSELGQLVQLTYLDLQNNTLTGTIPTTFSKLSLLNTLILLANNLSGNIDNLAPLTLITRLSLENNSFSGSMQTGLNGCKNALTYLSVNNNSFSGDLNLIFNNTNGNLGVGSVFIQRNQFSGNLPTFSVGVSATVAQCDFRYNNFTCLPSAMAATSLAYRSNPQNSGNVSCRY